MPIHTELSEKFKDQDEKYEKLPEFQAKHISKGNLEKAAADFVEVYNKAWAVHEGNKEMKKDVALKMFNTMKPVIDERTIWFVYHNDKPVAFWLNLPDLNQIFKHFNGRFGVIEKLRFLWIKKRGNVKKLTGVVFGVTPEYQGTGVDYYMILQAARVLQTKTNYKDFEMQWQGDFNPKILNISRNLGANVSRTLTTYRYIFDRTKEFKRHPILN